MSVYRFIKEIFNVQLNDIFHKRSGLRFNRETLTTSIRELIDLKNYFRFAHNEMMNMFGRTTLGAFWQPITTGVIVMGVGFIFGALFNISSKEYIPYFATSLVLWQYFTTNMNEFSGKFSRPGEYQHIPYSKLILFLVNIFAKNSYILLLNLSVIIITFLITGHNVSILNCLGAGFGLILFTLIIYGLGIILSVFGSRFSDVPNVVQNSLQIMFYITPVMWKPETISHAWVYEFNPLYYLFSLVRQPLIYHDFLPTFYILSVSFTFLVWVIAVLLWSMFAWRINYHTK